MTEQRHIEKYKFQLSCKRGDPDITLIADADKFIPKHIKQGAPQNNPADMANIALQAAHLDSPTFIVEQKIARNNKKARNSASGYR